MQMTLFAEAERQCDPREAPPGYYAIPKAVANPPGVTDLLGVLLTFMVIKMEASDFYNKRLKEDSTIGPVQLMEEYAKHIIEINFCDGSPSDFEKLTTAQMRKIHDNVNLCVAWVNT